MCQDRLGTKQIETEIWNNCTATVAFDASFMNMAPSSRLLREKKTKTKTTTTEIEARCQLLLISQIVSLIKKEGPWSNRYGWINS